MKLLRSLAHAAGSPAALAVSAGLLLSGIPFRFSDGWWLWLDRCVYLATLWLTIIVQAAQNRDTAAMQRKLDGLIHSIDKADNRLEGIEKEDG